MLLAVDERGIARSNRLTIALDGQPKEAPHEPSLQKGEVM